MTTIKEAIQAIKAIKISSLHKTKIAEQLLGKYKGVIPQGKTSTQFIRELRNSLYGKIQ